MLYKALQTETFRKILKEHFENIKKFTPNFIQFSPNNFRRKCEAKTSATKIRNLFHKKSLTFLNFQINVIWNPKTITAKAKLVIKFIHLKSNESFFISLSRHHEINKFFWLQFYVRNFFECEMNCSKNLEEMDERSYKIYYYALFPLPQKPVKFMRTVVKIAIILFV